MLWKDKAPDNNKSLVFQGLNLVMKLLPVAVDCLLSFIYNRLCSCALLQAVMLQTHAKCVKKRSPCQCRSHIQPTVDDCKVALVTNK